MISTMAANSLYKPTLYYNLLMFMCQCSCMWTKQPGVWEPSCQWCVDETVNGVWTKQPMVCGPNSQWCVDQTANGVWTKQPMVWGPNSQWCVDQTVSGVWTKQSVVCGPLLYLRETKTKHWRTVCFTQIVLIIIYLSRRASHTI